MTKTTLTATDSTGQTFTRTTARDYAFVVVTRADDRYAASVQARLDKAIAERADACKIETLKEAAAVAQARAEAKQTMRVTWASRLDLAEKAAAKHSAWGTAEIVPVG